MFISANPKSRFHFLPHQHVKYKKKIVAHTIKSSKDLSGILTMLSENKKFVVERNASEMNFNAEQKRNVISMRGKEDNPNLLLFSPTPKTPTTASTSTTPQKTNTRNCIVCSSNGLTTTALTMNLSSIGPLVCTSIGCIGTTSTTNSAARETNNRMSRSASPALGTENNTRLSSLLIGHFSNLFDVVLCFFLLNFQL